MYKNIILLSAMDPDEPATTSSCIPAHQLKDRWLTAFVFILIMGAPSFSGTGGGGGQDRTRGAPFDSREYVAAFSRFNQWGANVLSHK